MPVSKKQQASVNKYVRENYDRMLLTMPKGKKAVVQAHVEKLKQREPGNDKISANSFVNRAIDEAIARDNLLEP